MKNYRRFLILPFVLLLLIACNNTETKPHEHAAQSDMQLELDGDKRWIANSETTEGVNNMIQLMNSFQVSEDPNSYKTLASNLETEFKIIFQKCTMKGAAHDQLHNFLFPMKAYFKNLSTGELNESKAAYDGLKKHLSEYESYFE